MTNSALVLQVACPTFCLLLAGVLGCSASTSSDANDGPAAGAGGASSPNGSGGSGGTAISLGGSAGASGSGPETPTLEKCNGLDDDGNFMVDEGCTCVPGQTQSCFNHAPELDSVGQCARGTQTCLGSGELGYWGDCEGATGPAGDSCDNGIDEDCDGADAPCTGVGGAGGAGSGGASGSAGAGGSGAGGTSGCAPTTEICGNGIDEDCDGKDATCEVVCQNINLFGDCLSVQCPPSTPYPKSCQVFFTPGDDRGCVANGPGSPSVYFQAGDQCNAGFVTGKLCCAATPQPPLDSLNCPINKPIQFHVKAKTECPAIKS